VGLASKLSSSDEGAYPFFFCSAHEIHGQTDKVATFASLGGSKVKHPMLVLELGPQYFMLLFAHTRHLDFFSVVPKRQTNIRTSPVGTSRT